MQSQKLKTAIMIEALLSHIFVSEPRVARESEAVCIRNGPKTFC